jgi:drug/metabolite transporter (DMT)-like permease
MGRTEAATTTVFYFSAFSTLMLAFVMPFFAQQHDALTWGILLLLGVSGSIAQIAMSASLRLGAVSAVVSMDYTQLFWATAFGFVLFGQLPAPTTWTGAPFIIASGLYIAYREHRRGVLKAQAVG